ncbi:MAG: hypothetical protein A3G25_08775 [Betaproteobacteria bacterium RIFCSPLOWO2_12_FULL_63_13]|nr:MAG: hypothetical protein A3H32_04345 [Betaproteobacteria bacterium RIFCSPLOWO2_02_FULL_63_19]OGA47155.1 MAG: hypothetical protein A3G25_08775 [Betaproteobacteria bacterium RIFCSPLOWO2_12_FULL_63_13]
MKRTGPASLAGTDALEQPASYPWVRVSRTFEETIAAGLRADESRASIWVPAPVTSDHARLAGTAIVRNANNTPIAAKRKVSVLAFMVIAPFSCSGRRGAFRDEVNIRFRAKELQRACDEPLKSVRELPQQPTDRKRMFRCCIEIGRP